MGSVTFFLPMVAVNLVPPPSFRTLPSTATRLPALGEAQPPSMASCTVVNQLHMWLTSLTRTLYSGGLTTQTTTAMTRSATTMAPANLPPREPPRRVGLWGLGRPPLGTRVVALKPSAPREAWA